ncbi:MAG: archaetidylserine decarboxylase [Candidatus Babeliales bacterium]
MDITRYASYRFLVLSASIFLISASYSPAQSALPDSFAPYLYETYVGKAGAWFINNAYAARIAGWYADHHIPFITAWHLYTFTKYINTDDIDAATLARCRTFNDIFTRKLKPDARPIAQPHDNAVVVSPADGAMLVVPNIQHNTEFIVKGKPFTLERFFNNHQQAAVYAGGTLVIIYLSPVDYHRFHMPVTGRTIQHTHINGAYESVHPSIFNQIQPLQENERHVIMIETPHQVPIAYFAVGAMFVGQIQYTTAIGTSLHKGEELGYFCFGGSTIALLFPPNSFILDDGHAQAIHTPQPDSIAFKKQWKPIKMGQALGTITQGEIA